MDTTAIGIGLGLVGATLFGLFVAFKLHTFDMQNTVLVFLALFAVPGGVDLLRFAIKGQESDLPNNWREYLAVAAVVGIGLSADFLVRRFRSILARTIAATEQNGGGANLSKGRGRTEVNDDSKGK